MTSKRRDADRRGLRIRFRLTPELHAWILQAKKPDEPPGHFVVRVLGEAKQAEESDREFYKRRTEPECSAIGEKGHPCWLDLDHQGDHENFEGNTWPQT